MKRIRENFTSQQMFFSVHSTDPLGIEKEIEHRERVLRYATARMQMAISRMESTEQINYIICKYFYDMKNKEIAAAFTYCERHIYRLSEAAKKSLYVERVKLMPNPRRGEKGKRYHYSRVTRRFPA
jgi:hypothetical protein